MSDWSGKQRPILELIAQLGGRSVGVNIMGGSGGLPSLTDQDIAGAVAMARQYQAKAGRKDPPPLATCARPELLLLHWGSRGDMVPLVARRCADAIAASRQGGPLTRSAALLSAQAMSGRHPDMSVSTWALGCTVMDLQREMGYTLAWMQGELSEAERAYCKALRRWVECEAA